MRRSGKRNQRMTGILLAAGVAMLQIMPVMAEETGVQEVTYENLSQLVQQSQAFQSDNESYTTNKANYESLLKSLEDERDYMKLLEDRYEDDTEAEQVYSGNASALSSSITRVRSQLERLNNRSSQHSRQELIDSYTLTAQNLMNTYNQMVVNVTAKEKAVQAAEASCQAIVKKQSAGIATAAEVMEAADKLSQEKNLLESYRQQEQTARFDLLSTLGIDSSTAVTVGTIPMPDLAAITSTDLAADLEKAVDNSSSVQNARHSSAGTYTEIDMKAKKEATAEGTVRASVQASYQQMQAAVLEYQAALDSFESASAIWQSMQRRQQAGMISQTEYLEGEASYLEALASKETTSMKLYQTWESYKWEVAGVS